MRSLEASATTAAKEKMRQIVTARALLIEASSEVDRRAGGRFTAASAPTPSIEDPVVVFGGGFDDSEIGAD